MVIETFQSMSSIVGWYPLPLRWQVALWFSNRVLVETNSEASKRRLLKAFWSGENCLDSSTITKTQY